MTRRRLFLIFAILLLCIVPTILNAQQVGTLYSPEKYRNEPVYFCLNFQTGLSSSMNAACDLSYGLLGINKDFDWLQGSSAQGSRGVIKDLGSNTWTEDFKIPVIAALPRLKPGEQRQISIDVSGADGANGVKGADGEPSVNADDDSGRPELSPIAKTRQRTLPTPFQSSSRPEGKPKVDAFFVKAIVGHMYVAHVVDDMSDYYALFRVDALEHQTCSISWKLIPTPQ